MSAKSGFTVVQLLTWTVLLGLFGVFSALSYEGYAQRKRDAGKTREPLKPFNAYPDCSSVVGVAYVNGAITERRSKP